MKMWRNRLDDYFVAFCRRVFKWSPAYKEALKYSFQRKGSDGTEYYKCAKCGKVIPRPQKRVDHISPVVPVEGWDGSWDTLRDRMSFEDSANLQVLCHRPCHTTKTNEENEARRRSQRGQHE